MNRLNYTSRSMAIQKCESKNTVVYPVKATLLNYTGTVYLCFLPTYNWKLLICCIVIYEKVCKN